jgi:hypothetical protein
METEPRHQPVAHEGTDDADYNVPNEAKAGPLDDLTGQPPSNQTDEKYDEQTLV